MSKSKPKTSNTSSSRGSSSSLDSSRSTGRAARRRRNRQRRKQSSISASVNTGRASASIGMSFAPTSINSTVVAQRPVVTHLSDGGISVTGQELIGSNLGNGITTSPFQMAVFYYLNPGLASTFPWLSPIAQQYQEYKFQHLEFIYVPSCPTTTPGDVILSPNYNAMQSIPTSEQIAMNMADAAEGSVWGKLCTVLDTREMTRSSNDSGLKYIRSLALAGDLKTYDSGTLSVAFVNASTPAPNGRLFVRYIVHLYSQSMLTNVNLRSTTSTALTFNLTTQVVPNGSYNALSWDTVLTDGLNLGALNGFWPAGSFSRIYLPVGIYRVHAHMAFALAWSAGTLTTMPLINCLSRCAYGDGTYSLQDNQDVIVPTTAGAFTDQLTTDWDAVVTITPALLNLGQNWITCNVGYTVGFTPAPNAVSVSYQLPNLYFTVSMF